MTFSKNCFNAGIAALCFPLMAAICGHTDKGDQTPPPQNTSLLRILSDSIVWGKNLFPAIAQAEALQQRGQKKIELFPSAILSSERYGRNQQKDRDERINLYNEVLSASDKSDLYKRLQGNKAFAKATAKADSYPLLEIDSVAVGIIFGGNNYVFRPDTKMATVFKQFGKPETTDTRVLNGPGEERPQILTLYSYEKGIIIFAEADIAEAPGLLNRVFIDIPRLVQALKNEMK
jgi:hypothetical protein